MQYELNITFNYSVCLVFNTIPTVHNHQVVIFILLFIAMQIPLTRKFPNLRIPRTGIKSLTNLIPTKARWVNSLMVDAYCYVMLFWYKCGLLILFIHIFCIFYMYMYMYNVSCFVHVFLKWLYLPDLYAYVYHSWDIIKSLLIIKLINNYWIDKAAGLLKVNS